MTTVPDPPPDNVIRFKQSVDSRPVLYFPSIDAATFDTIAEVEMQLRENYTDDAFDTLLSREPNPTILVDKPSRTMQLILEGSTTRNWVFESQGGKERIKFYGTLLIRDDEDNDIKPYSGTRLIFSMRNSYTKGPLLV